LAMDSSQSLKNTGKNPVTEVVLHMGLGRVTSVTYFYRVACLMRTSFLKKSPLRGR